MSGIRQDDLSGADTSARKTGLQRGVFYLGKGWDYLCSRLHAPAPRSSDPEHDTQSDDPNDSVTNGNGLHRLHTHEDDEDEDGPFEAIVVDNNGFKCYKPMPIEEPSVTQNAADAKAETSSVNTDLEMNYVDASNPTGLSRAALRKARWQRFLGWDHVRRFSSLSEKQKSLEDEYWRERWFSTKRLTFIGGLWIVFNWVLSLCFVQRPFNTFDCIFYYMISPALVLPIPFMIMADMPSGGNSMIYQTWLCGAVWSSAIFSVLDGYLCGYFGSHKRYSCVDRDFFNVTYYACALPAIALFAMHGNRLPSLIGVLVFLILVLVLIVPTRASFVRHVIEVGGFHCFFLYTNYSREQAGRRVFILKEQMRIQYRSKQKAQIAERQEADSKRRLTNYIFHEVRVPLNTASLAFENIEASGIATKQLSLEFTALKGSLGMMSKVLSDILDFNRMDAGNLLTVERPYHLHKMMKSMLPGAALVGESRGIKVNLEFDHRIDIVARRAIFAHHGLPEPEIQKRLADPEYQDEGIVAGDEMRLRQIINNLVSNALKFNVPGPNSHVTVRTKLLRPVMDGDRIICSSAPSACSNSTDDLNRVPTGQRKEKPNVRARRLDSIVVRFEVEDSGVAIKPKDMAQNRLFSPFIQTEIGRTQGGKGTGLGLALVRHIVALSGGRLGVISQRGVGSTFWFEMSLGVGQRALREPSQPQIDAGTPTAFGMEFPKAPYPSPDSSLRNTPRFNSSEAVPTPSTFEMRSTTTDNAPSEPAGYFVDASIDKGARRRSDEAGKVAVVNTAATEVVAPAAPSELGLTTGTTPIPPPANEPAPERLSVPLAQQPSGSTSSTMYPRPTVPLSMMPDLLTTDIPLHNIQRPTHISLPPQRYPSPSSTATSTTLTSSSAAPPGHRRSDSSKSAITPATPKSKIGEGMRVLVVDDDQLTRRLMGRMLERLGCKVDTAEDGQLAYNILVHGEREAPETPPGLAGDETEPASPACDVMKYEHCYHLMFVDNQMPRMTGVELARQLRGLGRKDFLVGVTGNAMTLDQREYLTAGADHVLTKPVREESIKEMLLRARSLSEPQSPPPPSSTDMKVTNSVLQPLAEVTTTA